LVAEEEVRNLKYIKYLLHSNWLKDEGGSMRKSVSTFIRAEHDSWLRTSFAGMVQKV
jgi:hypothetical protein